VHGSVPRRSNPAFISTRSFRLFAFSLFNSNTRKDHGPFHRAACFPELLDVQLHFLEAEPPKPNEEERFEGAVIIVVLMFPIRQVAHGGSPHMRPIWTQSHENRRVPHAVLFPATHIITKAYTRKGTGGNSPYVVAEWRIRSGERIGRALSTPRTCLLIMTTSDWKTFDEQNLGISAQTEIKAPSHPHRISPGSSETPSIRCCGLMTINSWGTNRNLDPPEYSGGRIVVRCLC